MDFLRVVADKFSLIQAFEPSIFFQPYKVTKMDCIKLLTGLRTVQNLP